MFSCMCRLYNLDKFAMKNEMQRLADACSSCLVTFVVQIKSVWDSYLLIWGKNRCIQTECWKQDFCYDAQNTVRKVY